MAKKTSTQQPKQQKKEGLVPLADRVVLKPLSADEYIVKRTSGIIIPETVDKERPEQGKVIAVGPGRYEDGKTIPVAVKPGDIVLFSWGDKLKIDGEEFSIIKESEIIAVIK